MVTRRVFLGGSAALLLPGRHRRHAAYAATARGEAAVPVTILNNGTFNPGAGITASARVSAATGASLAPAVSSGSTTSAPAGLAAAAAAGPGISRFGPGLVGDNCSPSQYGGGTQAAAWTSWGSTTVGRTLQVWRMYFPGVPPSSINATLQAAATAGIPVAMSFKPTVATTLGGGNSTDRSTISSFLASCAANSPPLKAMVCMYHEPVSEIANQNTYAYTQAYYGPTVQGYYPLVYCGQCGDFSHGTLANYELYYNTAVAAGAGFDAAAVDYYGHASFNVSSSTLMDGHAAFTDSQGLGSFGVWEYGLDEDLVSTAVGGAWWNYMASFFTARKATGLDIGYVTHYSPSAPDGTGGYPFTNAKATYEIPYMQAAWDAVNN